MEESRGRRLPSDLPDSAFFHNARRLNSDGYGNHGTGLPGLKKRGHGHGSRSWIKIDQNGDLEILELDKATIMRHCSLPARDLRLLDPLFIYPSTILGREKAIVVSLEQIRCIITAEEVILMKSLDGCVIQFESEFCKRLQTNKDQSEDLPFEFRALELALELTCMFLDAQVKELEIEIYPVLDELASSINTLNLERVRRLKGHLLALTQRVQKVHDEIEHLMEDDGDMAEMYLTEKKQKAEAYALDDLYFQNNIPGETKVVSKSAPVSPVRSISGVQKLQRTFSTVVTSSKHGSLTSSSTNYENVDQLEMLLEAYFVFIDNTLSKLFSLKEYIDDTEDLINIKLGNVQNQLIQFELLLTAATFVATIFAVVTGIFGMNFEDSIFDQPSTFNWVLIVTGILCGLLYLSFLSYFKHKKVFPL
ncbi:magnesium transporter MRS2-5 [Ricinus communis]|uniref:magnesium transporter MRS2-5 n=1 Tax=Ricinus communis TaxID=3988 RepID=UPI0007725B94|nr:magnesium transporter MRS2-5 [Ricinus communis]XP_015584537.1 magnesium transporter MRS2-5 [Ricinus communis]XP_048234073.1 magnesium transporter MRS2-5 [Ricinus communis]|eukprot:XP_015584536.1 magnesium transporter MRS2-5 [Ricinus communis]